VIRLSSSLFATSPGTIAVSPDFAGREGRFLFIEPQLALALVRVRPVAGETVLR